MSAVVGFTGSLFSLAISKWSAKRMMGVRVISQPANATESWLVGAVQRQAQAAGIGMPEVGVFDSPEPNAFATGARRDAALVAVSTGLLQSMSQQEAEAVLAHEVSHVANGDMVTLDADPGRGEHLRVLLLAHHRPLRGPRDLQDRRRPRPRVLITSIIAQLVLGLFAMMIVMWFSRQREFRADAGGAHLAGRQAMIGALERLQQRHSGALPDKMAAFGIAGGPKPGGFKRLFMSHPPLEERIAALRNSVG